MTTTASERKPLACEAEDQAYDALEAAFARGCGDATILVANRKAAGARCSPDYLAGLLDTGQMQSPQSPSYWAGFCTLVRVCEARQARMDLFA